MAYLPTDYVAYTRPMNHFKASIIPKGTGYQAYAQYLASAVAGYLQALFVDGTIPEFCEVHSTLSVSTLQDLAAFVAVKLYWSLSKHFDNQDESRVMQAITDTMYLPSPRAVEFINRELTITFAASEHAELGQRFNRASKLDDTICEIIGYRTNKNWDDRGADDPERTYIRYSLVVEYFLLAAQYLESSMLEYWGK
jgi:hypothetical protein